MAEERTSVTEARPGMGRTARIVLFASLALNVLVVGTVIGAALRHDGPIRGREDLRVAQDAGIGPFGFALTREQRRDLGRDIAGRARALQDNRGEIRALFGEMLQMLRADDFDAIAFRRHLQEAQDGLNARQQIGIDALVAQLETMTDDQREAFADRLERSFGKLRTRH